MNVMGLKLKNDLITLFFN